MNVVIFDIIGVNKVLSDFSGKFGIKLNLKEQCRTYLEDKN